MENMLDKKIWAVVGATNNTGKYGYKIYRKLKTLGYTVYPINPNYDEVDGDTCYKNLESLPQKPEVINMVVAPKHGINTINEAGQLGIQNMWFQPGSYDDSLMQALHDNKINYVQACVLVEAH